MDEVAWRRYRSRARRRAGARMLLVIAPIGMAVAVLAVIAPPVYPPGDLRGDPAVRLLAAGLFVAFDVLLMIGSMRVLRAEEP